MALAWSTVVLIVLLLPGVLFFLGLYVPEQFTRDTTPKNALGQLAGVVLISFGLHALYLILFGGACYTKLLAWLPCVRLETVLALLGVASPTEQRLPELAESLRNDALPILSYVGITSLLAWLAGGAVGRDIAVNDRFRFLVEHKWVLDLPLHDRVGRTYAYVMTRLTHEGRSLIYEGRLKQFGLLANGQFSYLVLTNPKRRYMRLDYTAAIVDERPFLIRVKKKPQEGEHIARSFVVAGTDVAHVIFDRRSVPRDEEAARKVQASVDLILQGQLDEVYRNYGITPPYEGPASREAATNRPSSGTQVGTDAGPTRPR